MAELMEVAIFPPGFFLENIASTQEGGLLITCANRGELYYVHPRSEAPMLVHNFDSDQWAMGIAQAPNNPNMFFILTGDLIRVASKTCHLHVLDLANPASGCRPKQIMKFPTAAKAVNGLCFLSSDVLLAADSFAGCIWRIDLTFHKGREPSAEAREWLSHPSMAAELVLPDFQPGTNGLKYSPVTHRVYYTSTQQRLFCQVRVDGDTLDPIGEVEVVDKGMPGDDLIIDDRSADEPVAYVTTHRDDTIVKVWLDGDKTPRKQIETEVVAKGTKEDDRLLGPTAGTWAPSMIGRRAFFATDGGLKNMPDDGFVRAARVVMVDF